MKLGRSDSNIISKLVKLLLTINSGKLDNEIQRIGIGHLNFFSERGIGMPFRCILPQNKPSIKLLNYNIEVFKLYYCSMFIMIWFSLFLLHSMDRIISCSIDITMVICSK